MFFGGRFLPPVEELPLLGARGLAAPDDFGFRFLGLEARFLVEEASQPGLKVFMAEVWKLLPLVFLEAGLWLKVRVELPPK